MKYIMKFFKSDYFVKLCALAFTVLPGANRVILFVTISHLTSASYFSLFSSGYSFAVIISMVGGIGVGTVILKYGSEFGLWGFIKTAVLACLISMVAGLVILMFFPQLINANLYGIILLAFGLVVNQILRHMIIVKKLFFIGAAMEFLLAVFPVLFVLGITVDYILTLSFVYILQSVTVVLLFFRDNDSKIDYVEAFYIGHSNLISSGILFFLPMICLSLTNAEITKAVSLLVTAAGIVTVFPRAMLNIRIRDYQQYLQRDKSRYYIEAKKFKCKVSMVMISGIIIMMIYGSMIIKDLPVIDTIILCMAISLFIFAAQYSVLETMVVNLIGEEKRLLLLNFITFAIFIVTYLILNHLKSIHYLLSFATLCFVIFISYMSRYLILERVIQKA